jgi:hypothetical protein
MKKINEVLLVVAAITSIIFLLIVESFNNITLDDIGFALQLQKESVWKFIIEMYFTWQGRFMGFLLSSMQMKSYLLLNTMLPFSILLYAINIFLVSSSLINFFKLRKIESVLYAIIFFQLYVYSMFDISSYFWMCTKGYTLIITLSLFAFSELLTTRKQTLYDYVILFIIFAFLGCSYEIYAPVILLFMSGVLFYRLRQANFDIKFIVSENKKLIFSIIVGTLFFFLMIIAPGNWIRMNVHATYTNFRFSQYVVVATVNAGQLLKLLLLKVQYFVVFGLLILIIYQQVNIKPKQFRSLRDSSRTILLYAFISIGLCLVSVFLNTYAVGARMELRAFNHINLICFLFVGFSLYEIRFLWLYKKFAFYAAPSILIFIIMCNAYSSFRSVPELSAYKESVQERMKKLELLNTGGNRQTIKLEPLHAAIFHSVDDLWKMGIPKLTPRILLKPNEVSNSIDNFYNKTYRKYYKLDFDVVTDLSYEL